MDHVVPRSRGGRGEWLNAVAAHASCNEKKGSRTPEEAGMPLLWQPWIPSRAELAI
jgi:5-methylcytosine-specific restriction endonuclease McrA